MCENTRLLAPLRGAIFFYHLSGGVGRWRALNHRL